MKEYPNRIRELRLSLGWNQDDLALRVSCSKMQISGLERGKPKLDIDWMRRIAEAFGVLPADLLIESDNPLRLNQQERELILRYREADEDRKADLLRVADALLPFDRQDREAA